MQSKTKAPTVVIGARIPEPMKDALTEAAQQAGRSLGQEIIHRLAVAELVIGRRLAT
jgi:Arc-like DNA binding domain